MFGDRKQVTWKEVGQVPLCLLTPDMQNRRIIDRALRSVGAEATPTLTSNSLLVLYTHVKTGRWASVMPAKLAETLGLADTVRSIPIVDPVVNYSIGLVIPQRDPMTPLIAALVQVAREVAPTLEPDRALRRGGDLRLRVAGVARQRHADDGAGAELGAQPHRAAMQVGQRPCDGKPKPRAVIGLGELALDLLERPAEPRQRLRRMPMPVSAIIS